MPCRATQVEQVVVQNSDKTWSTGEWNGKPLQYSCLENPIKSYAAAATPAKSFESCDPIDSSPPGSAILGILQARTQEWVDLSFSNS